MVNSTSYFITLAAFLALSFSLFATNLRRKGLPASLGLTSLFFSIPFGYLCAKLIFLLIRFRATVQVYGLLPSFVRVLPEEFSYVGGAIGVTLAVVFCAKLRKVKIAPVLDAFAPVGCLLVAGTRLAEYFLGTVGWGGYVEAEWLCRFPFALQNRYGEWFSAIFMLEAAIALICLFLALAQAKQSERIPGLNFERTVYRLCIAQIIPEMLRAVTIIFSFVRTEQVLCALIAFCILAHGCARLSKRGQDKPFLPCVWMLLLVGVNVALQFALDKPYLFIDPLPLSEGANEWLMANSASIFYGIMLITIVLMLLLEAKVAKKLLSKDTKRK